MKAAILIHAFAAVLNAIIVLQTWPINDQRILLLVGAAFVFSILTFLRFASSTTAHAGAAAFHLAAIGAVLLLPLPMIAAVVLLLIFPALVIR